MAQMPALIPKEVEIQRLKKIYIMVIMLGSIAASVEVDNFVDGSLHQTAIRDSAFTPAHWWLYSHFIALPLGWGFVAMYDRKVPILRGPNNSMNTGLKMTILGYLATMFTIGINELWHFWFVEEIFSVPNHWMFNMGVVVAFMGALAYVVRVYARLVELGAETPAKNPYVAEMYKLALEGKLYQQINPIARQNIYTSFFFSFLKLVDIHVLSDGKQMIITYKIFTNYLPKSKIGITAMIAGQYRSVI